MPKLSPPSPREPGVRDRPRIARTVARPITAPTIMMTLRVLGTGALLGRGANQRVRGRAAFEVGALTDSAAVPLSINRVDERAQGIERRRLCVAPQDLAIRDAAPHRAAFRFVQP